MDQNESRKASKKRSASKWLMFLLRWGIAVVGIYWVITQMSFSDKLLVVDAGEHAKNHPVITTLAETNASEDQQQYRILGRPTPVDRFETVNKPDRKEIQIAGFEKPVKLLGYDLKSNLNKTWTINRVLIERPIVNGDPQGGHGEWVAADRITEPGFKLKVPYPRVDTGLARLFRAASDKNLGLLILAIAVFPLTYIITAYRWHELLIPLQIFIGMKRAFMLNMVGAFYNTFMPGSTGGDVLKAIYAAKQTTHKTRAVMSVLIDRIIGLLALIILGGTAAATQWQIPQCRHIAIISAAIIAGVAVGLTVFYQPTLHKLSGLDWLLSHLPMQKQVKNAVQVMEIYQRRPLLVLWTLLVTFPVHITVIISATFAGKAFGLPLAASYYWAIVPVLVLVQSLPISPQGAGVMEFFAIELTKRQSVTVSQAFALTMSIRLVAILWNLTGFYFVARGHFHKPTEAEKDEMETDEESVVAPEAA